MQRHLHPRALLLTAPHEISINTPQNSLVRHDEDILAAFQLHDDRFEPDDYVTVGLPSQIAVVVLVVVARFEIGGVLRFNLGVGEAVADARVELVEGFPRELFEGQEAGGLRRAFERRGPDGELQVAGGFFDEVWEFARVELAAFGDVGVAADLAAEVEHGFAVLEGLVGEVERERGTYS